MDMQKLGPVSRVLIALTAIIVLSGCISTPRMAPDTSSPTETATTEQIHAQGQITEILDNSNRFDDISDGGSYIYKKGKYNKDDGRAVAVIEVENSSSKEGPELYKVWINLTNESITSINPTDKVNITTY